MKLATSSMLPRELNRSSFYIILCCFSCASQARDLEKKITITEENLRDLLKKLVRIYLALYRFVIQECLSIRAWNDSTENHMEDDKTLDES